MPKEIKVSEIIAGMLGDAGISALVGDRIYYGAPIEEVQTGPYITVNIVPTSQKTEVTRTRRIDIRVIGHNKDVYFPDLENIKDAVSDYLLTPRSYGTFETYKVEELSGFKNDYDDKQIRYIITDYRFYFVL